MARRPGLNALHAFEVAGRLGSFALAAAELGVTAAAVSRHVRNLENDLGLILFRRGPRSIALTADGARLAARLGEGFAILFDFEPAGAARTQEKVVLEVDTDLAMTWLLPRLTEAVLQRLDVRLDIRSRLDLPYALQTDTDLAILWGVGEYPDFRSETFLRPVVFPVSAPVLADGRPAPPDLSALTGLRLIHERDETWWRDVLGLDAAAPLPTAGDLTFHRTDLCVDACAAGLGLAVGDDVSFAGPIAAGRLVQIGRETFASRRNFELFRPRRRRPSDGAGRLTGWLLEEARRHRAWQADRTAQPAGHHADR